MSVKTYSLKKDGNKFLSAHFQVKEFKCKDGTDKILINTKLIDALEKLYKYLNCKAINITSGYRTPAHSVKVGGYKTDQHTKGNAADITCKRQDGTLFTSNEICCALEDLNYAGGVGKINNASSVHIDVRGKKCWFDETANEKVVSSWYDYLGVKRPESTLKGDVNNDRKVTAEDARIILRVAAGLQKLFGQSKKNADMNNDGDITAEDARKVLRKSAKLE
jgi:hypothetical protein